MDPSSFFLLYSSFIIIDHRHPPKWQWTARQQIPQERLILKRNHKNIKASFSKASFLEPLLVYLVGTQMPWFFSKRIFEEGLLSNYAALNMSALIWRVGHPSNKLIPLRESCLQSLADLIIWSNHSFPLPGSLRGGGGWLGFSRAHPS